jgi:hypothetical protein
MDIFRATIPGKTRENRAGLRNLRTIAKEIGFTDIEKTSLSCREAFFAAYMLDERDEKAVQEAMTKVFDPILYPS